MGFSGREWALCALAATLSGQVYVDEDLDGTLSAGDTVLAGATVGWNDEGFVTADSAGRYSIDTGGAAGVAWVRTPDGFSPAPVWAAVAEGDPDTVADLGLVRSLVDGPLQFVVAADTHIGYRRALDGSAIDGASLYAAMFQAAELIPEPHFVTIVGDMTHRSDPEEFAWMASALDALPTPFVPVPGNHDWYDGGVGYRASYGPATYSFDAGGVHFIVLPYTGTIEGKTAFLVADAALTDPGMLTIAFTHAAPGAAFVAELEDAGVDYLFTGHWHGNRVIAHDSLIELNTQPMIRGALDFTPAGYRVVTVEGGELIVTDRTTVAAPLVEVTHPRWGDCGRGDPLELIVAVQVSGERPTVTASMDGGAAVSLEARSSWTFGRAIPGVAPGRHELRLEVHREGREPIARTVPLCVTARPEREPGIVVDWPQYQGSASHHGAALANITPPLITEWAVDVGGRLQGGSATVSGGMLFVPIVDLADARHGGVVALTAATGAERWRYETGVAVRGAPAVADGIVVIGAVSGVLYALDQQTGELRWAFDLGEGISEHLSVLHASPTIADGIVYAGVARRLAALDLATGTAIWTVDPSPSSVWQGSFAAATVADGIVVGMFSRGADGVGAWDALTGEELWRIPKPAADSINATPLIADGRLVFANTFGDAYGYDLQSGFREWQASLVPTGSSGHYSTTAGLATADERVFVPTVYGSLFALHTGTGTVLWQLHPEVNGLVSIAHKEAGIVAFAAAPVVVEGVLWVGGADGLLRALDARSGELLWSRDLGSPILQGPVPSGDFLFVGTFDGTMRALRRPPPLATNDVDLTGELPPPPEVPVVDDGGCGCRVGAATVEGPMTRSVLSILGIAALLLFGCSGKDEKANEAPPAAQAPPPVEPPAPAAAAEGPSDSEMFEAQPECANKTEASIDQCLLTARALKEGRGVEANKPMALAMFDKTCEHGSALGCMGAGMMYNDGDGVTKDLEKARASLTKSCEGGMGASCLMVGIMYDEGVGTPQDQAQAVRYYQKGCSLGDAPACANLGAMHLAGTGVDQNAELGVKFLAKACEGNEGRGCGMLGIVYAQGKVVDKDVAKGTKYLQKSCKLGFEPACKMLTN